MDSNPGVSRMIRIQDYQECIRIQDIDPGVSGFRGEKSRYSGNNAGSSLYDRQSRLQRVADPGKKVDPEQDVEYLIR